MDLKDVDQILWRRLTWTDFKGMTGQFAGEGGGSQKHINLPASKGKEIADFFDRPLPQKGDDPVFYDIPMVPVPDAPGSEGPITISCKPDRRGGEWRITDQHNERYELWKPDHGFPTAEDLSDPEAYYRGTCPIIYIVKDTESNFHARFLYPSDEAALEDFPTQLRDAWNGSKKGETDIIELSGGPNKTLD